MVAVALEGVVRARWRRGRGVGAFIPPSDCATSSTSCTHVLKSATPPFVWVRIPETSLCAMVCPNNLILSTNASHVEFYLGIH